MSTFSRLISPLEHVFEEICEEAETGLAEVEEEAKQWMHRFDADPPIGIPGPPQINIGTMLMIYQLYISLSEKEEDNCKKYEAVSHVKGKFDSMWADVQVGGNLNYVGLEQAREAVNKLHAHLFLLCVVKNHVRELGYLAD